MKNAILFGANGYLGRHIAYFLMQENIDFLAVDFLPTSVDGHANYLQLDVMDQEAISAVDFSVDYIFAFAGLTGTEIGFDQYEKFIQVNELGLLNILNHHSNSSSSARIIFPSTRLVYKGVKDTPLVEESEKEARTIYAQNKLACENYLRMYHNYYDIDYTVFRICIPYGNMLDDNYSYGTIGMLLSKAAKGEDLTLYGDGGLKRTFTHVEDISRVIIESLSSEVTRNQIYNIGSNDNLSLLDVAKLIASLKQIDVKFVQWPDNALKIESGDTIFNGDKCIRDMPYRYRHSVQEWIESVKL